MTRIKILTRTICDKRDVAAGEVIEASPSATALLIALGKAEIYLGEVVVEKAAETTGPETEIAEAPKPEPKRTSSQKKTTKKPKEG